MSILSLALYGSRARQDEVEGSDIDLFSISDDAQYRMIVHGNTNIASYPRQLAVERAEQGDLFMLHIVSESQTLYDPREYMNELKDAFNFRSNYDAEIKFASDIAWMLIDQSQVSNNFSFLNRRTAWCVRTILIAKAANKRFPIFSARGLADFSGSSLSFPLINGKNDIGPREESVRELELFVGEFGHKRPLPKGSLSLHDYAQLFAQSENVMGDKTLTMLQSTAEDFYN
ncbi:nucleotidyltransferase domain-containing protein [Burkholderia sp. S171]|uniref:anti-phage Hailong system nucleotidyltransferase HalB n=1 Tax=Burkholderia sp. S171 TaxID=1641860 RepID=UPI00131CBA9E|nr:nucleotidyltransferase domain-containing protein [Burkholderia sp. S171]